MKNMALKESDPFFHCKGNYEAASRGMLGAITAAELDYLKELKDIFINRYPIKDSMRDMRANYRGMAGALTGKTLFETCPTHHSEYK